MSSEIKKQLIKQDFVANLYTISNTQKRAGIILLSGSDGGLPGENVIGHGVPKRKNKD